MKRKPIFRLVKAFLGRFTFAWLCARTCSPFHVDYIATLMALENMGVDSHTLCEHCFVNARRQENIRKEEKS